MIHASGEEAQKGEEERWRGSEGEKGGRDIEVYSVPKVSVGLTAGVESSSCAIIAPPLVWSSTLPDAKY